MSIPGSDSASRTESKESAPRRPEEDAARSPYVPKRARLMHGARRYTSASPSSLMCRDFWPLPISLPRGRVTVHLAVPNSLGAPGRSGRRRQPA